MEKIEFEKNGPAPEKKDKTGQIVRSVVFGIALLLAALSAVGLFVNFCELAVYSPINYDSLKDNLKIEWMLYQDRIAGFSMAGAILSVVGIIFALVSIKKKRLRPAASIVLGAVAFMLLLFTIIIGTCAVGYVTEDIDIEDLTYPTYVGGSSRLAAAVSLSSGFVASALQPCICFAAMAICTLTMFLADRKEKAVAATYPDTHTHNEPLDKTEPSNEGVNGKFCVNCGAQLADGALFCISCGKKINGNG